MNERPTEADREFAKSVAFFIATDDFGNATTLVAAHVTRAVEGATRTLREERDNYKRSVENAHAALDKSDLIRNRDVTHQGLTPRIKSIIARTTELWESSERRLQRIDTLEHTVMAGEAVRVVLRSRIADLSEKLAKLVNSCTPTATNRGVRVPDKEIVEECRALLTVIKRTKS